MEAGVGWGVHCSGINGSWMQFRWGEAVRSTVLSKAFIERQHCSITQCLTQLAPPFTWASPLLWQWVCILINTVAVRGAGPGARVFNHSSCVTQTHFDWRARGWSWQWGALQFLSLFGLWPQDGFSLFCSISWQISHLFYGTNTISIQEMLGDIDVDDSSVKKELSKVCGGVACLNLWMLWIGKHTVYCQMSNQVIQLLN